MPRVDADLKLDFKDVLFRPKRSSLKSRSEVGAAVPVMFAVSSTLSSSRQEMIASPRPGLRSARCCLQEVHAQASALAGVIEI